MLRSNLALHPTGFFSISAWSFMRAAAPLAPEVILLTLSSKSSLSSKPSMSSSLLRVRVIFCKACNIASCTAVCASAPPRSTASLSVASVARSRANRSLSCPCMPGPGSEATNCCASATRGGGVESHLPCLAAAQSAGTGPETILRPALEREGQRQLRESVGFPAG
eukprot:1717397-Amphidinium_carterae.1